MARVLSSPAKGVYSTHIDSGHHFRRHFHDGYGFGFLEHGAQEWFSGRGTVRGYPGDVISTNPGEVHDGRPIGAPTRRWRILYIDVDVMSTLTAQHGRHAEIVRPVVEDRLLLRTLQQLFFRLERWHARRSGQHSAVETLAVEEALVDSCVRLIGRHGSTPISDRIVSHDLEQVRERLADESPDVSAPSLGDLAAMTGLSRYQLLRRFEKAYGLPPHAWLLRRRAERARVLIRDGCTLAVAAAACGFADQSHMNRVFMRQFGFTPGAWQKALQ